MLLGREGRRARTAARGAHRSARAEDLPRREKTLNAADVPLVALEGARVVRGGRGILAVARWGFRAGERWVLMGRSGSGKSTFLKVLLGLEGLTEGAIRFRGEVLADRRDFRRRLPLVGSEVQEAHPDWVTALECVVSGPRGTWGLYEDVPAEEREAARAAMRRAGLGDRVDDPIGRLSWGERRRCLLLRALAARGDAVLFDEALSGLDFRSREEFLAALEASEASWIFATHHFEEIPANATHALWLKDGAVLAAGPAAETITEDIAGEALESTIGLFRTEGRWRAVWRGPRR